MSRWRFRPAPNVHGRGVGDLAVRFTVAVPRRLSDEQKRIIEELRKLDPAVASEDHGAGAEGDEHGFFFRRKKKKR